MCFKQEGTISDVSGEPHKLVDQVTYVDSNISSTKIDVADKIKWDFFQVVAVSAQMYGYTTWTKETLEKNTRSPSAVLNKSRKQHPTKQPLHIHLPSIL